MRNLIKKNPRYSKRINYDALRDLFDGAGPSNLDEKLDADEGLWRLDPDKEDEDMADVVIEEGGGGVGMLSTPTPAPPKPAAIGVGLANTEADGEVDDDVYGDVSDKGEDYVEWDGYEQEV